MENKNSFDERLVALRFLKNFKWILLITLIGTVLMGSLYVLKNVVFSGPREYEATSRFLVSYEVDYHTANDYYINGYTWNDYLHSDGFMEGTSKRLKAAGSDLGNLSKEQLVDMTTADVEADFHVVTVKAKADSLEEVLLLAGKLEETMTEYFPSQNEQVSGITVLDKAVGKLVPLTARPVRAFILSAVVTFFFSVVIYLIWEIGTDSLWIPGLITREYGVRCVGTIHSTELAVNLSHLFSQENIVLAPCDFAMDPAEIAALLKETTGREISVLPDVFLEPEAVEGMRGQKVLLVALAGSQKGKSLQRHLEFLKLQDIEAGGLLLWDADEALIKKYYRISSI